MCCHAKTDTVVSIVQDKYRMFRQAYLPALGIGLIALLALALRLHHLDFDSLFMDEIRQVSYYDRSYADIAGLAASQTQPPLDYWIGKLFYTFSPSDFSIRLPAALSGFLAVFLITKMLSERFGNLIGMVLGIYLAVNHFHIYYSQEARPYSLAIFLFIVVLHLLHRTTRTDAPGYLAHVALFIAALLYLHSRALTPLLSLVILAIMLYLLPLAGRGLHNTRKHLYSALALTAAIILYLPSFLYIYKLNQRYLDSSTGPAGMMVNGLRALNVDTFWAVISAQTGSVGVLMALLVFMLPFLLYKNRSLPETSVYWFVFIYTFALLITHFFIHHANSGLPLRPPYAFYVLPLFMVLSAAALAMLKDILLPRLGKPAITVFLVLAFVAPQAVSTFVFKEQKIRSDWKSLANFTRSHFDHTHLLIFGTRASHDSWHPGAYGFIRYPHGHSQVTDLTRLVQQPEMDPGLKPVFVYFHYRNYFLLPSSRHGVMPIPGDDPVHIAAGNLPDGILVNHFAGFDVFRLSHYTGNFRHDARALLKAIAENMDQDSSGIVTWLAYILMQDTGAQEKINAITRLRSFARDSQIPLLESAIQKLEPRR